MSKKNEETSQCEAINDKNEEITNMDGENQEQEIEKQINEQIEKTPEQLKIEQLEDRIKELEDKVLRHAAEYQNFKKRMEREKKIAVDYASERFAVDLLNVIDSLENGAKSFNEDDDSELLKKIKEGFELTIEQCRKVFEKHGINQIDVNSFDPNYHNAIMQIDSAEHKSGEIVQTFQKGYTLNNRVLRAAMVTIAK